jgi:hypothetical protein
MAPPFGVTLYGLFNGLLSLKSDCRLFERGTVKLPAGIAIAPLADPSMDGFPLPYVFSSWRFEFHAHFVHRLAAVRTFL